MADRSEMHSYLMSPAGLGTDQQQRYVLPMAVADAEIKPIEHRYMTHSFAGITRSDRYTLALGRMPPERTRDSQPVASDLASHQSNVQLAHRSLFELARERGTRERRPRHHHH